MKVKTCDFFWKGPTLKCHKYVMSSMNKDVLFSLAHNQYQNFITSLESVVLKTHTLCILTVGQMANAWNCRSLLSFHLLWKTISIVLHKWKIIMSQVISVVYIFVSLIMEKQFIFGRPWRPCVFFFSCYCIKRSKLVVGGWAHMPTEFNHGR